MNEDYEQYINWVCPTGAHTGTLVEIKEDGKIDPKTGQHLLRFIWRIDDDPESEVKIMAGKNYLNTLDEKKTLFKDLSNWLGLDFMQIIKTENGINWQLLVGRQADLKIRHHSNSKFRKPFAAISSVRPVGTLKKRKKSHQQAECGTNVIKLQPAFAGMAA